jgi:hypothetical protein
MNRATRSETVYVGLATLIVIGGYVDAWAHRHLASTLETFFTPWHGLLYGAALATSAWLGIEILAARRAIGSWRSAVPLGYELAVVGVVVVFAGGVGDMLWHTVFGIEVSVDALLSPTHLLLAGGFLLVVGAPARAWLIHPEPGRPVAPAAILSVALAVASIAFITQYLDPFADYWPAARPEPGLTIGMASILLQSVVLAGGLVVLQSLGPLRLGSIVAVVGLPALAAAAVGDTWLAVPPALIGAAAGEVVVTARDGVVSRSLLRWLVALVLAATWATYMLVLGVEYGLTWSVHAIVGAVVLGAAAGFLVTQLAACWTARAPVPAETEATRPTPIADRSAERARPAT